MVVALPATRLPRGVRPFEPVGATVTATVPATANRASRHAGQGAVYPQASAPSAASTLGLLCSAPELAPGPGPNSLYTAVQTCAAPGAASSSRCRHRSDRRRGVLAAATPSQGHTTAPPRPVASANGNTAPNGLPPSPAPGKSYSYNYPATTTSSSSSTSAAPFAPLAASPPATSDLRLDLWLSLLQASASQISAAAAQLTAAAAGAATRLQRLSSPPPPAFPAGPSGDQTLPLLTDPLRFLTDATATYGPVVGLLLGGERVALVTGRAEARAVLVEAAGEVYVKEGTAFFPGSSLAGE